MEVYVLILVLSIVQSLFGVGLLLFGTPIMLLLGYEYTEALLYLLPASAALSWSQVKDLHLEKLQGGYRKLFFMVCLPLLALGMVVAKSFDLKWEIKLIITIMLFLTFIIRSSEHFVKILKSKMKANLPLALGAMGIIHGLSNMGGSILVPLVSSLYTEKKKVLAGVSFDYAFMASFQLIFLLGIQGFSFKPEYLVGAAISLFIRYSIGKRFFSFTSESNYQSLLNKFILVQAVVLAVNL